MLGNGDKPVPSQLIWALHDLVKETKKSEILNGLYDQFFPQWVKQLHNRVIACKKIGNVYPDNDYYDSVLALLSVSLINDEDS